MHVSELDIQYLEIIRKSVSDHIASCAARFDVEGTRILEVAPQIYENNYFKKANIETLDINPGATYTADLCCVNMNRWVIGDNVFDVIICTEVLEHVRQPFYAVKEVSRMLKKGGYVYASTPFNFRIHGPLPDCWRFSEHGIRELFKDFAELEIKALESDRFLMPIHYTIIARK